MNWLVKTIAPGIVFVAPIGQLTDGLAQRSFRTSNDFIGKWVNGV